MKKLLVAVLFLVFVSGMPSLAPAYELSGNIQAEGRFFPNGPLYSGQRRNAASLSVEPEFYQEWENGLSLTFTPFVRLDSADDRRSHVDIRELSLLWVNDDWEVAAGIHKVFWGVTEFNHLVDVINQTDLIESPDGEEKLGQPMLRFSVAKDWGILDAFVLTGFRERTYPGSKGRLRFDPPVEVKRVRYESREGDRHVDLALRYSKTIGDWEVALSHFAGTSREPELLLEKDAAGNPILIPYYRQVHQTGLELQLVYDAWLWKTEGLYRSGGTRTYYALTGGFEYTFTGIFDTRMDLGVIGEAAYDDRGQNATTSFQKDVMGGLRLTVNDMASSEILLGFSQDLQSSAKSLVVEAERRFGNNWKLSFEAQGFFSTPSRDLLYSVRKDSYLQLGLAYYF